jgi:thioredoxin 1
MEILSNELKSKIDNGDTVMVAFTATFCGPCRMYKPTFNKLSESSQIPMYIMSVDEHGNQDYAVQLGIRAVPTTKLFSNGVEMFSKPGMMSEIELKSVINNVING